jgi:hygromycin-B 7''-O-kinase
VRLDTGVMRYHLLTAEGPERTWRLSGLIDFEPAMHGEREYEFADARGICRRTR